MTNNNPTPTHYTIDATRAREHADAVTYVPGHSLGAGWVRHICELNIADTADNPASTKGPIYGPCVVVYDVSPSGIRARQYDDAAGFYADLVPVR